MYHQTRTEHTQRTMDNKFNFKSIKKQFAQRVQPSEAIYASEDRSFVKKIYENRFHREVYFRDKVYKILCSSFFQKYIGKGAFAHSWCTKQDHVWIVSQSIV